MKIFIDGDFLFVFKLSWFNKRIYFIFDCFFSSLFDNMEVEVGWEISKVLVP